MGAQWPHTLISWWNRESDVQLAARMKISRFGFAELRGSAGNLAEGEQVATCFTWSGAHERAILDVPTIGSRSQPKAQ